MASLIYFLSDLPQFLYNCEAHTATSIGSGITTYESSLLIPSCLFCDEKLVGEAGLEPATSCL